MTWPFTYNVAPYVPDDMDSLGVSHMMTLVRFPLDHITVYIRHHVLHTCYYTFGLRVTLLLRYISQAYWVAEAPDLTSCI